MSGDEIFVTLVSTIVGPLAWLWWFMRARQVESLRRSSWPVRTVGLTLAGCAVLILGVLRFCAADDVRDAPQYIFQYFVMGLAWLRLSVALFSLLGLNTWDDLLERRNVAAAFAWIGAAVACALTYSGGNVGNGPGWWVVVFSSGLASLALFVSWFVLAQWGGLADAVALDRDRAAGIRLGGFLIACGLIFSTAVTGDWVSASATIRDFIARGWPADVLIVLALVVEVSLRRPAGQPRWSIATGGIAPAVVYIIGALFVVQWIEAGL